jgi:hypothetical protein
MELAFQNTIHPASFLLGAQLAVVIRFALAAELRSLAMHARCIIPALKGALRRKAASAFQKQLFIFSPA